MTTPVIVEIQINTKDTLNMVAEQGSLGLTFRHVPVVNDAVVSASNPMPSADAASEASMASIHTSLLSVTEQLASGTTAVANLLTTLVSTLSTLPSNTPVTGWNFVGSPTVSLPSAVSSDTVNIETTVSSGSVILLFIGISASESSSTLAVTGISDSVGLTWNNRGDTTLWDAANGIYIDAEIWWAVSTGINVYDITINFSETIVSGAIFASEVSGTGININAPFDTYPTLPVHNSSTTGEALSVSNVLTNSSNPLIIAFAIGSVPTGNNVSKALNWNLQGAPLNFNVTIPLFGTIVSIEASNELSNVIVQPFSVLNVRNNIIILDALSN